MGKMQGFQFNVADYTQEGGPKQRFANIVTRQCKPTRVMALRYAEKKQFLDQSMGFRIEDPTVPFLCVLPGPLSALLSAADAYFASETKVGCWVCGATPTDGDGADSKPKPLKTCARCKTAKYCSADCQRQDWDLHKAQCKHIPGIKELTGSGRNPFSLTHFEAPVPFP